MVRPRDLPERAQCVIIGGGGGGTSIAYHLGQLDQGDVILVDRNELTSGSTFHSAGLVGQLRSSVTLTRMMMYSVELYRRLREESEFDPGWTECGGIRLASSRERLEELRRQVGWARTFGLPLELISADEARELFPLMSTEGVLGASLLPHRRLPRPLAAHVRACGRGTAQRRTDLHAHAGAGIDVDDGRVWRVRTDQGDVETEVVVNAGGMYAAEIGRMVGVRIPIVPMAHEYLVTQPFRERGDRRLPTLRDPDLLVYFREDGGGLVMAATSATVSRRSSTATAATPSRATSTAGSSRRTGTASRRSPKTPAGACRPWTRSRSRASSTVPRRSPPTTSSASARPMSAASSSRQASARTGWPVRVASAR